MFTIEKILVVQFGQSSVTISNELGTGEMTVRLSTEQANEVEKLVREILATELRMPMIKEKLEAAKAVSPMAPPPAEIKTPTGTASFTPDGYKPDKGYKTCSIHGVDYVDAECPMCVEARPTTSPDDDIPF